MSDMRLDQLSLSPCGRGRSPAGAEGEGAAAKPPLRGGPLSQPSPTRGEGFASRMLRTSAFALTAALVFFAAPAFAQDGAPLQVRLAAYQHRVELLGELAGMVTRWSQAGRPEGTRSHRLHRWAKLIGGILEANGFDGFLTNYEEAAQSFNAELEELTALAEAALAAAGGPVVTLPTEEEDDE